MEVAGYIASVFIGISLGLIGGGGSILTVPVLVYLLHVDALLATVYSLFVVGTSSLVGSVSYFRNRLVSMQTVIVFGFPSIVAVFLTRQFIFPAIPSSLFPIGTFVFTREVFFMTLFAALMIAAAYSMIRKRSSETEELKPGNTKRAYLVLQGIFVGFVTGLIGAGGGFLIIPALVNFLKLSMKQAIGTSLVIITVNSFVGFLFSFSNQDIRWFFLLSVTFYAIAGMFIGMALSKKINSVVLKPIFGWFVLIMGLYILLKEILFF